MAVMNYQQHFLETVKQLHFAFQPIVTIETKTLLGVEALLRGVEQIGFESIHHFFDFLYEHELLYSAELILRKKVFEQFSQLEGYCSLQLFYNLDNRILNMPDYQASNTDLLLQQYNIPKSSLCFEISERHEIHGIDETTLTLLNHYKREGFNLAIDDFGAGFSGFRMLYDFTPHVIKIDRFFLQGICKDLKKRVIVENMIQLAKHLNIKIIAEGIELESELAVCLSIGCQYVQGYLIQRPLSNIQEIQQNYSSVQEVA